MSEATDIVRRPDGLGRFTIPVAVRRRLGLVRGSAVEMYVRDGCLILRPWAPGCVFCGTEQELLRYRGRWLCVPCRRGLRHLLVAWRRGHPHHTRGA